MGGAGFGLHQRIVCGDSHILSQNRKQQKKNNKRSSSFLHHYSSLWTDRAIDAREKQDDLREGGVPQGDADIQNRLIFTYPAHPELHQHMQDVREFFLDTFRTNPGDYDPRNPKPRDVWYHLQQSKDAKLTDLEQPEAP